MIPEMGWGSGFDGWSTRINLCNDCYNLTDKRWWELNVISDNEGYRGSWYEFESEIFEFVDKMPLAGQELFYNRYSNGWNSRGSWEPQDYIDYELGILPHEKCKKYGVYSHEEIRAYRERFSKCQHPVNVIYNDESKGCRCPFGAFGKYGGLADEYNVWDECYQCKYFTQRTTPIKDISSDDYDDYVIYYKAKLKQEEFKNKFG
jgi:hypothetical protein